MNRILAVNVTKVQVSCAGRGLMSEEVSPCFEAQDSLRG